MLPRLLLAAALLVPLASSARGAEGKKGLWEGCGVGSFVQMKTTSKTAIKGSKDENTVEEDRRTLLEITDAGWKVKSEKKSGGKWVEGNEEIVPLSRGMQDSSSDGKGEKTDLGLESVTIDGKPYPCHKSKRVMPNETKIEWVSDEHGKLKGEGTGKNGSTSALTVLSLAKKVTIGGKDILCRETRVSSQGPGPKDATTIVTLESDAMPSHMVRVEMHVTKEEMKMDSLGVVVAFEVK